MGKTISFKINNNPNTGSIEGDHRAISQQFLNCVKKGYIGLKFHERPEIKYPVAMTRIAGHVNPGEKRRQAIKASKRKATRAEVHTLCKYLLYRHKKFVPGKMV